MIIMAFFFLIKLLAHFLFIHSLSCICILVESETLILIFVVVISRKRFVTAEYARTLFNMNDSLIVLLFCFLSSTLRLFLQTVCW